MLVQPLWVLERANPSPEVLVWPISEVTQKIANLKWGLEQKGAH